MQVEEARFGNVDETTIVARIDGKNWTVPVTPGAGRYKLIEAAVANGLEISPYEEPEKIKRDVGTPREFFRLFTKVEQDAFVAAKMQSHDLELWWMEASAGTSFWLGHPEVARGLDVLVGMGILAQERKGEILDADFDQT